MRLLGLVAFNAAIFIAFVLLASAVAEKFAPPEVSRDTISQLGEEG